MRERGPAVLPLVSILTPSFNQGAFIADTLESVRNQDYPRIEHIVMDGGSSDGTLDVIRAFAGSYDLRWVSEPDAGQSAAVNKALAMARGDIVGWLNSDDVFLFRDTISRAVARFRASDTDVLVGDVAFLDRDGTIVQFFGEGRFSRRGLIAGTYNPGQPAIFLGREVLLQNPLREDLHDAMDLDLWLRLSRTYRVRSVAETFAGTRMYPAAKSSSAAYLEAAMRIRHEAGATREPPRWRMRLRNVLGLKLRGMRQLVVCRYLRRSALAAPIRYAPFPVDIANQLFRKLTPDHRFYWPRILDAVFRTVWKAPPGAV